MFAQQNVSDAEREQAVSAGGKRGGEEPGTRQRVNKRWTNEQKESQDRMGRFTEAVKHLLQLISTEEDRRVPKSGTCRLHRVGMLIWLGQNRGV